MSPHNFAEDALLTLFRFYLVCCLPALPLGPARARGHHTSISAHQRTGPNVLDGRSTLPAAAAARGVVDADVQAHQRAGPEEAEARRGRPQPGDQEGAGRAPVTAAHRLPISLHPHPPCPGGLGPPAPVSPTVRQHCPVAGIMDRPTLRLRLRWAKCNGAAFLLHLM